MIFHEIYGKYFETVSAILEQAVAGDLTKDGLAALVREHAFGESMLTIPANLKDGTWSLLREDLTTPLQNTPHTPLTDLQRQWMKALLLDPRIRLFDVPEDGLADVEPLFDPETFVWFDRYTDGDPYENENYIRHFRLILQALREYRRIKIKFWGIRGSENEWVFLPARLEYSPKDDNEDMTVNHKKLCFEIRRCQQKRIAMALRKSVRVKPGRFVGSTPACNGNSVLQKAPAAKPHGTGAPTLVSST